MESTAMRLKVDAAALPLLSTSTTALPSSASSVILIAARVLVDGRCTMTRAPRAGSASHRALTRWSCARRPASPSSMRLYAATSSVLNVIDAAYTHDGS
jgi:hypothetical protein